MTATASACSCVQVVVLWVGTNNHKHTAEQVAGGILAIAELLTSRLPKAKIIVLVSWAFAFRAPHVFKINSFTEDRLVFDTADSSECWWSPAHPGRLFKQTVFIVVWCSSTLAFYFDCMCFKIEQRPFWPKVNGNCIIREFSFSKEHISTKAELQHTDKTVKAQ